MPTQDAIEKYHRLRDLAKIYFLTVLEAGSPRSAYQHGWVWVRPLFLVFRWLPSQCAHMVERDQVL